MGTIIKTTVAGTESAITHYASITEMELDCRREPLRQAVNVTQRARIEAANYGRSWYGVDTLDEVRKAIVEGYPAGAAMVDALYDDLAATLPRAVEYRRRRVRGSQGDTLDIHAVNRGALDKAWETTQRRPNTGSGLIRIAVDICGNCGVGAEKLQWRGVAALALSRAMTKAGYSVELVAGLVVSGYRTGTQRSFGTVSVTVKPRSAVIDSATLAASVCLPGFFRYLGFLAIVKLADEQNSNAHNHLGSPVKLETTLPVPEKMTQVIVPESVNDKASAMAWTREALALLQTSTVVREGQQ